MCTLILDLYWLKNNKRKTKKEKSTVYHAIIIIPLSVIQFIKLLDCDLSSLPHPLWSKFTWSQGNDERNASQCRQRDKDQDRWPKQTKGEKGCGAKLSGYRHNNLKQDLKLSMQTNWEVTDFLSRPSPGDFYRLGSHGASRHID